MIKFEVTAEEAITIAAIVDRAIGVYARAGRTLDRLATEMDLTACHANGCPLDLEKLLWTTDGTLIHDIAGIGFHLDRNDASPTGGQLLRDFLPRCARREPIPEAWMLTEEELAGLAVRDGEIAKGLRA